MWLYFLKEGGQLQTCTRLTAEDHGEEGLRSWHTPLRVPELLALALEPVDAE